MAGKKTVFDVSNEIRFDITNSIVEALKIGLAPWRKPWSADSNCGHPTSFSTHRRYKGINPMLLGIAAMKAGWTCQWWGTYKHWQSVGGQVRKGEKGTKIVLYKPLRFSKRDEDDPDEETRTMFYLRTYNVWNLDQVDSTKSGNEDKLSKFRPGKVDATVTFDDWQPAEDACEATGADTRHVAGNRACYHRPQGGKPWPKHTDGDFIQMPMRYQFPELADYYGTKLHEMVHWTEIRRGWDGSYAMGELIAEIGGCYLVTSLGIPQSDDLENHNKYLQHWLKSMNDDPKWIFKASTEASRAADYVLGYSDSTIPIKRDKSGRVESWGYEKDEENKSKAVGVGGGKASCVA